MSRTSLQGEPSRKTMLQPAIPEFVEDFDMYSPLHRRTESLAELRELGPPDFVHMVKQSKTTSTAQFGTYHYVTGTDASSSASLAAYVTPLAFLLQDKHHKVVSGIYCCYNAFSHVDMRVEIKIPGTVESWCVDERGDRRVTTDTLWLETFVCGVLRAYAYADDGSGSKFFRNVPVRRFNPITSTEMEHKFLDATEKLFFSGHHLGTDPETQAPTVIKNHLTINLLKYINTTGRYASGRNIFEKLRTRDVEVSSLLAQVLFAADEEVLAVRLLHDCLIEFPMNYALLDVQTEFLLRKGEYEMALICAKHGITAAPNEFSSWYRLAEVYVAMEKWDLALLTLNSCPMFNHQDRDMPMFLNTSRLMLPILPETSFDEFDDPLTNKEKEYHDRKGAHESQPFRTHVSGLKGTHLKAYDLLAKITHVIGWDQLLRIRSEVFVMEEEYRAEHPVHVPMHEKSSSVVALRSSSPTGSVVETPKSGNYTTAQSEDTEEMNEPALAMRPGSSISSNPDHQINQAHDQSNGSSSNLYNKRICERWLDILFMQMYEDLRAYTNWRTETTQAQHQGLHIKRSAIEWEARGKLSERLLYFDSAIEAYRECLRLKFSATAMVGLMKAYQDRGDIRGTVNALIRLVAWQYRQYSEFSPELLLVTRKLIASEGALKIRNFIQATNLPQHILDLTHSYCQVCASFHSNGSDF